MTDSLPDDLKAILRQVFDAADANGNGSIDAKELKIIIENLEGVETTNEQVQKEMVALGLGSDGTITFDEMCTVIAGAIPPQNPAESHRSPTEWALGDQITRPTQSQTQRRPGSSLSGHSGQFVGRGPSPPSVRASSESAQEINPSILAAERESTPPETASPSEALAISTPAPPLRPPSFSRPRSGNSGVFSRPGPGKSKIRPGSAVRIAELSKILADGIASTSPRATSSRQLDRSLSEVITLPESPGRQRARQAHELERVRQLRQDALDREQRRLRELETGWLKADHTHFAHSHHIQHKHSSQHHHPVSKPLQEYAIEQREKMIASYSKAATRAFKMADKAAQASARAEICALHAFSRGSKSEGNGGSLSWTTGATCDVPSFPVNGQSSHIHVSVSAVCNLPRHDPSGTDFGKMWPQPVVKARLEAMTFDTLEMEEAACDVTSWLSPAASADILGNVNWDVSNGVVVRNPFLTSLGQGSEAVALLRCKVLSCQEVQSRNPEASTDVHQATEVIGECVIDISTSISVGETRVLSRALVSRSAHARHSFSFSPQAVIKAVRSLVHICFLDRIGDVQHAIERELEEREAREKQDDEELGRRWQQAYRTKDLEDEEQARSPLSQPHSPVSPQRGNVASSAGQTSFSSVRSFRSGVSLLQALGFVRKDPEIEARQLTFKLSQQRKRSMAAAEAAAAAEEAHLQALADARAEARKASRLAAEEKWARVLSAAHDAALSACLLMLWRGVVQLKRSKLLASGCQVYEDLWASEPHCSDQLLQAQRRLLLARHALAQVSRAHPRVKAQEMVQSETQALATPPPSPPSGQGHRRKHPRAEMAEVGADGREEERRARREVAQAESACSEAEARLLSARQRGGSSSHTCDFAGTRITVHLKGLAPADAKVEQPSIEDNGKLTDVEENKLRRDRVVPLGLGMLDVTVSFPAVLWRQPHFLPADALRGPWCVDGANGVGVRLKVSILSAVHLPQMDNLGKIDAYVKLLYAQQEHATSVQASSYTPVWNETFAFDIPSIYCARDLQIALMDHDRVGAHELVGSATISSVTLLDRVLGHVAAIGGGRGGGSGGGGDDGDVGDIGDGLSSLRLTVLRARNLLAADRGGTSDPYVRIHVGEAVKEYKRTKVVKKTLNPEFDETFDIQLSGSQRRALLTLQCFDYDMIGSDDLLGIGRIALDTLVFEKEYTHWLKLEGEDENNEGEVEVRYMLLPDLGVEDVCLFREGQQVVGKDDECATLRLRINIELLPVKRSDEGLEECRGVSVEGVARQNHERAVEGERELADRARGEKIRPTPLMMRAFGIRVRDLAATPFLPQPGGSVEFSGYAGALRMSKPLPLIGSFEKNSVYCICNIYQKNISESAQRNQTLITTHSSLEICQNYQFPVTCSFKIRIEPEAIRDGGVIGNKVLQVLPQLYLIALVPVSQSCQHIPTYLPPHNTNTTGKDKWLEERIFIRGVPLHEHEHISISATLGPPDISAQAAHGFCIAKSQPCQTTTNPTSFPTLSTGPFALGSGVGGEPDSQGSLVLLSDYSLVTIQATIEYASYVHSELKRDHIDGCASIKGPKVQVCLEQLPAMSTDSRGGVRRGGGDIGQIHPQIIYTTAAADCVTHPNWGEKCSIALSWGVCKRAALRFRLLPDKPGTHHDWHLGEVQVLLSNIPHEEPWNVTQHLQPHISAEIDKACGHLHVRFVIKPHLASSHGRFFLSTRWSPSMSVQRPADLQVPNASRLDVSWYGAGQRMIDGNLKVWAARPVKEQSGTLKEEEKDDMGLDVKSSNSSMGFGFGTREREGKAQPWSITVHELVGVLPERVKGSRYQVVFFSGLDGSFLGSTRSWSSPGGVWQHEGGRHVELKGLQDTKVPIVAKILSEASLSRERNRSLLVAVKAARGLTAMDVGGTSDPYVTLSVGCGQRKDKRAQSKVVSKCLNPEFDEHLQVWLSDREVAVENLLVSVWDKDLLSSDDLIGQISIPLLTLSEPESPTAQATWHTLCDTSGSSAGEVLLEFELAPPVQPAPLALKATPREPRLNLVVYLVQARGLLAADIGGTSDPYATLELTCDYLEKLGDSSADHGRRGPRNLLESPGKHSQKYYM